MIKRIGALVFIFVCTTIAWLILGAAIFSRTYSPMSDELRSRVAASWGTPQEQSPPTASYQQQAIHVVQDGNVMKQVETTETVPFVLEASKVDVALDLEHRQKGLLWYNTYKVEFAGDYTFTNYSGEERDITFRLIFPSQQAIYDGLAMSVDGKSLNIQNGDNGAFGVARVPVGKTVVFTASY